MPKSLLEQLPDIVADGRKEAERILESLESRHRVALQTREMVFPAKDALQKDWLRQPAGVFNAAQGSLLPETQPSLNPITPWSNRLIYGDNLLAMAALLAGDEHTPSLRGKVDLIYIDPPFDSKADYRTRVTLPGVELEQKPTVIEQFAYSDTWSDGTASYLAMITPRLILMRELLSDSGSIYVHLDWHVGHYVKIVMDEVFGKENLVNELVWRSANAHNDSNRYGSIHSTIYFFQKTSSRIWNGAYKPYENPDKVFKHRDERGSYQDVDLTAPGGRGPRYAWKGVERNWLVTEDNMKKLDADRRLHYSSSGLVRRKFYEHESKGISVQSIWDDIGTGAEGRTAGAGYDTAKPPSLLERIIRASCPEGGLVADFFGGSGTTAAVAEKLGRRWITTDLGKPACMVMRKRLIDQNAQPFLYQAIGDYQVESAKTTLGRKFKIGDLAQIVLQLYGALPLSPEDNPNRNLGRIPEGKTLVLVDSPAKMTGLATLKKALALRDTHLGGWDKVVVLGWNFDPAIVQDLLALNDKQLEVLVIPPDLLDRLKKKGALEKLRKEIRFSTLQYLTVKFVTRSLSPSPSPASGRGEETLTVELDNYVLLSPDAINLDEANRAKLQQVINHEPLALIEYWAVDPDYDGVTFRSLWQDYRGNTANDEDALRCVTRVVLSVPTLAGVRRVCVRAVDVFGFESEVLQEVA